MIRDALLKPDLFTVKEAIADASYVNKYCQDGVWVGSSVDFAALGMFPNLLGPGSGTAAGTFSIGSYYCWNSSANLQFYMPCTYVGATTADQPSSLDLGLGITPIIGVFHACYTKDILGPTDGVIAGLGTTVNGVGKILKKVGVTGGVGYDWGGPVRYLSFSFGAGIPALDMLIDGVNGWEESGGHIQPEGSDIFISYRSCDTSPAENVFEWWLGTPGQ